MKIQSTTNYTPQFKANIQPVVKGVAKNAELKELAHATCAADKLEISKTWTKAWEKLETLAKKLPDSLEFNIETNDRGTEALVLVDKASKKILFGDAVYGHMIRDHHIKGQGFSSLVDEMGKAFDTQA